MQVQTIADTRVLVLSPETPLATELDATDVVGWAFEQRARVVAIATEDLAPEFFDLSTRLAGGFIQKLVNYRITLAVIGSIDSHVVRSESLAAFVRESNRGNHVWFLDDLARLDERLAGRANRTTH